MTSKVVQVVDSFGALLELSAVNLAHLTATIRDADATELPMRVERARGCLDVIQARMAEVRSTLDSLDGGR